MIETPPNFNSSINDLEFSINAAKNGHTVDQWMCHFFGNIVFGMQLWATPRMMDNPSFHDFMEALYPVIKEQLYSIKKVVEAYNPKPTLADLHEHE